MANLVSLIGYGVMDSRSQMQTMLLLKSQKLTVPG